jgi:S-adenosyl-L-methionine hydrolase (adenosine-forming)
MKGVIAKINPKARLIDITHSISAYSITEANLVLAAAHPYFPPGTIFLCVVDPGVGGKRRPIAVETPNYFFVGPDNGIISGLLEQERVNQAVHLNRPEYFLSPVSHTFHGRDIFAPVSAYLSLRVPLNSMGTAIKKVKMHRLPVPKSSTAKITGQIIHIDSFGNLVTNFKTLPPGWKSIEYQGRPIHKVVDSYSQGSKGELIAIWGSFNYLEIALREKHAAQELKTKVGDVVEILL